MAILSLPSMLAFSVAIPSQKGKRGRPKNSKMPTRLANKAKALLSRKHSSKITNSPKPVDSIYTPLLGGAKRHRVTGIPRKLWRSTKDRALGIKKHPRPILSWPQYNPSPHPYSPTSNISPTTQHPPGPQLPQPVPSIPLHRSALSALGKAGRGWLRFWQPSPALPSLPRPFIAVIDPDGSRSTSELPSGRQSRPGHCLRSVHGSNHSRDWETMAAGTSTIQGDISPPLSTTLRNNCTTTSVADASTQISLSQPLSVITPGSPPESIRIPSRRLRRVTQPSQDISAALSSDDAQPAAPKPPVHRNWGDLSSPTSGLTRVQIQEQATMNRPSYAFPPSPQRDWADLSSEVSTLSLDFATRGLPQGQDEITPTPGDRNGQEGSSPIGFLQVHEDSLQNHSCRSISQLTGELNDIYRGTDDINADAVFFDAPASVPPPAPRPRTLSTPSITPPPLFPPMGSGPRDTDFANYSNGTADVHFTRPVWYNTRYPNGWRVPNEIVNHGARVGPNWRRDDCRLGNAGDDHQEPTPPRPGNELLDQTEFHALPASSPMPQNPTHNLAFRVDELEFNHGQLLFHRSNMLQRLTFIDTRTAELRAELAILDRDIASADTLQRYLETQCFDQGIDADGIINQAERRALEERDQQEQQWQPQLQQLRHADEDWEPEDAEMYDGPPPSDIEYSRARTVHLPADIEVQAQTHPQPQTQAYSGPSSPLPISPTRAPGLDTALNQITGTDGGSGIYDPTFLLRMCSQSAPAVLTEQAHPGLTYWGHWEGMYGHQDDDTEEEDEDADADADADADVSYFDLSG